jgi:YggT family protein
MMIRPYFSDAGLFLIDTVLGFYILIVMLRFLLQLTRADFYNPISKFVVKVTNPPLTRLRRVIPGFWGIDLAAVVLLITLESLRLGLITILLGHSAATLGVIILSVAELLKLAAYVVIFSIFIRAIMSWFSSGHGHAMTRLLGSFTEPFLRTARRLIPSTGGLDLSPLIVFIALMLFLKIVVQALMDLGHLLL